jgi:DNA-binding transcriptional regulator YiaG
VGVSSERFIRRGGGIELIGEDTGKKRRRPPAMATRSDRKRPMPAEERKKHAPKSFHFTPGLRSARLALDLSQQKLARRAGTTQVTVSRLEWEDRQAKPATVVALARALGVKPRDILKGGRYDPDG